MSRCGVLCDVVPLGASMNANTALVLLREVLHTPSFSTPRHGYALPAEVERARQAFLARPTAVTWDYLRAIFDRLPSGGMGQPLTTLRDCDLRGADLRGASLCGQVLSLARLRGANLERCDLRGADLRGADLRGAALAGARLDGADLIGATYDASTVWPTSDPALRRGGLRHRRRAARCGPQRSLPERHRPSRGRPARRGPRLDPP